MLDVDTLAADQPVVALDAVQTTRKPSFRLPPGRRRSVAWTRKLSNRNRSWG